MEMQQEQEWAEAQKISLSVDLVEAAKKLLRFLAVVDRNRYLYEDHALERAIYRYNAFWLPLLARHLENSNSEDPLIVPLDCEWIWHCHRLNPIRYKFDCEKLFGKVLDNYKVISSVEGISKSITEAIWKKLYPREPYELDLNRPFSREVNETFTNYDLISAVRRQISFTFQVSRPYVSDDLFLQEAVARYKGFLHLIRTNQKMNLKRLCVPTYDIDLMWHAHQLCPNSYHKDMKDLVGYVVQHDDSDSNRTKGSKLDVGHSETTRQWEHTFGLSYWKAGAMYRGSMPAHVTQVPFEFNNEGKDGFNKSEKCGKQLQFSIPQAVEVLLEFKDIKHLPEENRGNLLVAFSKKKHDRLFGSKRSMGISSHSKEKVFAIFECDPTGDFLFELMSSSPSNEPSPNSLKLLGSCSLSLKELLMARSQLSINKWISIDSPYGLESSKPILLHVSMSITPPTPVPQVFQLVCSETSTDTEPQVHVMGDDGKKVFSLQTRNIVKNVTKSIVPLENDVYCITESGESLALLKHQGNYWCVLGTHGSFKLQTNSRDEDCLFELVGHKMVKLFPGRRLDFEPKHKINQKLEQDFVTAVEFSEKYPYGRAVALINSNSKIIKAIDEWIVLPSIALAFMLCEFTKEDFYKESIIKDEEYMLMNKEYGSQCIGQCVVSCVAPCVPPLGIGELCDIGAGGVMDMAKRASSSLCVECAPCGGGLCAMDAGGVIDTSNIAFGSVCGQRCIAPPCGGAAFIEGPETTLTIGN